MSKLYSTMISGSDFGMFLQVVPITLLVGSVYAVYSFIRIKRMKQLLIGVWKLCDGYSCFI